MARGSTDAIEDLIRDIIGKDVLPLVKLLRGKKDISEFKLADKLKLNINNVRNLLYKLGEYNLVSSIRKKDKKKGWYVYYWTFDEKKSKLLLISKKEKELSNLQKELKQEENCCFFVCPKECIRLDSQHALEVDYRCDECGSLLMQEDNAAVVRRINREMEKVNVVLEEAKAEPKKKSTQKRKAAKKKTPGKKPAKKKPGKKVAKKQATKKKTPSKRKPTSKKKPTSQKKSVKKKIVKRKSKK